jgi:hypothetical protein
LSTIGNNGFGIYSDIGSMRLPIPALRINAFIFLRHRERSAAIPGSSSIKQILLSNFFKSCERGRPFTLHPGYGELTVDHSPYPGIADQDVKGHARAFEFIRRPAPGKIRRVCLS